MTFTPTIIGTGLAGYAFLNRTGAAQQEALANTSQVQREAEIVAESMPNVQTSDDLLDDRLLLRISLGAFGLDEDINNRAFLKQVLDSDLSDPTSLANRLSDKRYLSLAQVFGFNSEEGPTLVGTAEASELVSRLESLSTPADLLADQELLTATLASVGLPDSDADNTYFLQQVLDSDLSDPNSFANSLTDTRYAALVDALGFEGRSGATDTIIGFAQLFSDSDVTLNTADDLIGAPELISASLEIYGLADQRPSDDFLRDVLNSDLQDPNSFANQQRDERWASFANAFGFGDKLVRPNSFVAQNTRIDALVSALETRDEPYQTSDEFFADITVMLAVTNFFDLPQGEEGIERSQRVLASDRTSSTALVNLVGNDLYRAFFDAVALEPEDDTTRTYPPGFTDGIMEAYVERQFEIQVGAIDPDMRLALGFERELNSLLNNATSNNARWFGVLGQPPLRTVFEAALGLPESVGSLDLDRQLEDFKDRAETLFGTSDLATLAEPENVESIRERFLSTISASGGDVSEVSSPALVILSTIQGNV